MDLYTSGGYYNGLRGEWREQLEALPRGDWCSAHNGNGVNCCLKRGHGLLYIEHIYKDSWTEKGARDVINAAMIFAERKWYLQRFLDTRRKILNDYL